MRTRKLYKAAREYVQGLLENEFVEGFKEFVKKALDKLLMDGTKGAINRWKDYLIPKAQAILRLIVSRDPVGCCRNKW